MGYIDLKRSAAPASEPIITVAQAKEHCNYGQTALDTWFAGAITRAQERIERVTLRQMFTADMRLQIQATCLKKRYNLQRSPVIAVSEVGVVDIDGNDIAFDASAWYSVTGLEVAQVELIPENLAAQTADLEALYFKYSSGYGTTTTTLPVWVGGFARQAVGIEFENRTGVRVEANDVNSMEELEQEMFAYRLEIIP